MDKEYNNSIEPSFELKTEKEAMVFLRCSNVALWRYRKNKEIPFYRIAGKILYKQSELELFVNNQINKKY